ncbi:hypothetical protein ACVWWG_006251 [Bradyrhizobium sp. LB7.2]|uniref:hypothetical protein n=1 Tax=Bradyrhizobium sp. LB14.3 TaxID=3156328 RepID=UPI003392849E
MAPFEALNFFVPDLAFDETARELGSTFSGFPYDVEREYRDEIATSLARAVLPALSRPAEIPMLSSTTYSLRCAHACLLPIVDCTVLNRWRDRNFPVTTWLGSKSFFLTT